MRLKESGLLLGLFLAWILLTRWVLPWFGFNTCISGACPVNIPPAVTEDVSIPAGQEAEVQ